MKKLLKKLNKFLELVEDRIVSAVRAATRTIRNMPKRRKILLLKDLLSGAVAAFFILVGVGLLWFSSVEIPDLASFDQRVMGQSTKIFDRTGKILLYDLGKNMRRTVVPFEEISPNLKNAAIAVEDAEFYEHRGIRISALMRALFKDITAMEFSQGGSTITQQVVKNSLLTREKTITRKLKEILLAIKVEQNLSKDEILNLYLNETSYGGTIYGVEEASKVFFGKGSKDVSVAEAAYIAAIPQSPTRLSPFGNHREELDARKNLVLAKMNKHGYLNDEEYTNAKSEVVEFRKESSGGIKAPHFVMFIREYLEQKYGEGVAGDGLKVTTTLDYSLQEKAEEIIKRKALENDKLYHATNAGLVAVDAKTGQILVMVGSRDYFDDAVDGQYNIATAERQPGSSFKPFVYAAGLNKGYTPETILFDLPIQFSTLCAPQNLSDEGGCYSPGNYDGNFRGPISVRNALAQSINVPAVEMLYLVGVNNAIDLAEKMGITTLRDRSRFGLSLVLGGGEVTLLEMTGAYSTFANEGVRHPTTGILKIESRDGRLLEEFEDQSEEVLSRDTALTMSDILSDNDARTPIFGARSSLYFPDRDVAAKTGTTNDYRDAWVIGYTPHIAVGAWSGNNDNSPIDRKVAGYIVAPMWHEFMNTLLATLPNEPFPKPETKDTASMKPVLRGVWQGADGVHSILHYVDKDNPQGPAPTNPWSDPQYSHWEYAVQAWSDSQGLFFGGLPTTTVPTTGSINLFVSFISPYDGAVVQSGSQISAGIRVGSNSPIVRADYYLNGIFIGSSTNLPFNYVFTLGSSMGVMGQNTLSVTVTDQSGARQSSSVAFTKQ